MCASLSHISSTYTHEYADVLYLSLALDSTLDARAALRPYLDALLTLCGATAEMELFYIQRSIHSLASSSIPATGDTAPVHDSITPTTTNDAPSISPASTHNT